MELGTFFENIGKHPELAGISIDTDTGVIAVEHKPSRLCTTFPANAVKETSWELMEEVLTGKREPDVLYHMTRIVGYYSRVENWNNSKLGEMKARIQGHYTLEGAASEESTRERMKTVNQIQNS